jgi:hypothetical protein
LDHVRCIDARPHARINPRMNHLGQPIAMLREQLVHRRGIAPAGPANKLFGVVVH